MKRSETCETTISRQINHSWNSKITILENSLGKEPTQRLGKVITFPLDCKSQSRFMKNGNFWGFEEIWKGKLNYWDQLTTKTSSSSMPILHMANIFISLWSMEEKLASVNIWSILGLRRFLRKWFSLSSIRFFIR